MLTLNTGGWEIPIDKEQVCSLYLLGVKKAVLVALRLFIVKRSTVGTFAIPLVLTPKNVAELRLCIVLEFTPLRGEKMLSHAHKTGSWSLIKISDEHCVFFIWNPPLCP